MVLPDLTPLPLLYPIPWKAEEALSHFLLRHTIACHDDIHWLDLLTSGCKARGAAANPSFRLIRYLIVRDDTLRDIDLLLASSFSQWCRRSSFERALLVLAIIAQKSATVVVGMQIHLGCSSRRSEPSAPYFDFTDSLSRLCARQEAGATMEDSGD
jgi:hypothetical protein